MSPKVRVRFPTYKTLVEAGLLLPGEDARLSAVDVMSVGGAATLSITALGITT